MKKIPRKRIPLLLLVFATLLSFAACGGKSDSKAAETETFTFFAATSEDASYGYDRYEDNPSIRYLTEVARWTDKELPISLKFTFPISGQERDTFSRLIESGEYKDVMDMNFSSVTALQLYEEGIALDLTEYVNQYMPNYLDWVAKNPEYAASAITVIDGEPHYIQLVNCSNARSDNFFGVLYRRDWIVEFGRNPSTGAKFTGGLDGNGQWSDDVVFPSWYDAGLKEKYLAIDPTWDGTDPVYISDWEWMFSIMQEALESFGITSADNGYVMGLYYPGHTAYGGLNSSFGGGTSEWYMHANGDGTYTAGFGALEPSFKAYLQCMRSWYQKGFLDPAFDENTSDAFYMIDSTLVAQGRVGLWVGQPPESGANWRGTDPWNKNFYAMGARWPVNDVYGTDQEKFVAPDSLYQPSLVGSTYIVTKAAEGKNMEALFTFLDYLYSFEGAQIKSMGLTEEQRQAVYGDSYKTKDLYAQNGAPDGLFTMRRDGNDIYYTFTSAHAANYLMGNALKGNALVGMTFVDGGPVGDYNIHIDRLQTDVLNHVYHEWDFYTNVGFVRDEITNSMTSNQSKSYGTIKSRVEDSLSRQVSGIIKASSDAEFERLYGIMVEDVNKKNPGKVTEYYQEILDRLYPGM